MKYNEIKERVGWGEEFFFIYQGEKYWISKNDKGFYLTRVKNSNTQTFKTSEELFEKALIDRKTLTEIWGEIEEFF